METLKKQIIRILSGATTVEGLENNKVIIVTAMGMIIGTPYIEENYDESDLNHHAVPIVVKETADAYGTENIDGNDGFIMLSDVTIKNGVNNVTNVPSLVVFYDQIIGITIGSVG